MFLQALTLPFLALILLHSCLSRLVLFFRSPPTTESLKEASSVVESYMYAQQLVEGVAFAILCIYQKW